MPHSPGPWFVFGNGYCVGGPVDPGNGLCDNPEQKTAGIAMCGMRLRENEECEANAKLIAAAPDLLAAVKDLLEVYDVLTNYGAMPEKPIVWGKSTIAGLRNAVAKVTF